LLTETEVFLDNDFFLCFFGVLPDTSAIWQDILHYISFQRMVIKMVIFLRRSYPESVQLCPINKGGRKCPPSSSSINTATLIDLSQASRALWHTEQEPEAGVDGNEKHEILPFFFFHVSIILIFVALKFRQQDTKHKDKI